MPMTKVFMKGRCQAVLIPEEYRFDVDEVSINKIGEIIVLTPLESLAHEFDMGTAMIKEDYLAEDRKNG